MAQDAYFKKTITFNYHKQTLRFQVSQALFSSHQIDPGTHLLLKSLGESDLESAQTVLDLGCGYGPLGLTLKKMDPKRTVHLVDRDALAVDYTRQNAVLNGLAAVEVYGSLGFDDVRRHDFDLIVSNIPGKMGERVISQLLQEARHYLAAHGRVVIVVAQPLEGFIVDTLTAVGAQIDTHETARDHAVFHYRFPEEAGAGGGSAPAFDRGLYDHEALAVKVKGLNFAVTTVRGLAEFDTLNYQSTLLLDALWKRKDLPAARIAILNPGQGQVPVSIWQMVQPATLLLASRDLLSLRCATRNLLANGCPAERLIARHAVGLGDQDGLKVDLMAWIAADDESPEATGWLFAEAARALAPQGKLFISGKSTTLARVLNRNKSANLLALKTRRRSRGKSLLIFAAQG